MKRIISISLKRFVSIVLALTVLACALLLTPVSDLSKLNINAAQQSGIVTVDQDSCLYVRSGASTSNSIVGRLYTGNIVTIQGSKKDSGGTLWYQISYSTGTATISGYSSAAYITLQETSAEETSTVTDDDFEAYLTAQGFPESYKPLLRQLHAKYPNWVFKAQKTGLKWSTVLAEESVVGRSLVPASSLDSWKSVEKGAYDVAGGYWYGLDGSSWVGASQEIIAYYLDPRNFLNTNSIFMFENLSYSKNMQTISGVKNILSNTFMKGSYTTPDTNTTYSYAQSFLDAAALSGVSPYHLASRAKQEQGISGTSLSFGTVASYQNYFNFFNIQAYSTATLTAQQMGARYAASTNSTYLLPWTNQYKSIRGGALIIGNSYINKGQNTLYLQKFDVVDGGNGYYSHQYMTNVIAAYSEAALMKAAYTDSVLQSSFEFLIPVYESMPSSACAQPTSSGSNNNWLNSLSVSGQSLSPTFNRYTTAYSLTVNSDVSAITINAKANASGAKISGTGKKALNTGENKFKITVTAPSGVKRTYTLTVTRQKGTTESAYKLGDVNNDDVLDLTDVMDILCFSAQTKTPTDKQRAAADFDQDGVLTLLDALGVLQKAAGIT